MSNLNVSLPEAMKQYIENEVKRGAYSTPSEFVRELVRDFQRRKAAENEGRLLDALLDGTPIADDPTLQALQKKLRARIDQKLLQALDSPARPGNAVMARVMKKNRVRVKRRQST
jgi:antitoxin ParD1/3/4